ncbi:CCC motif membrane protein [Zeaxanthinibacter enoshimensis]|uniref:CCC motif membrane protein n=1 Tax=Zeaxanthinibacter enoshimensis TaxID=392009 RepID=UPI003569C5F2
MEQQKLPNVTIAIVLSILGYLCCCIWGVPGIVLGGIALILIRGDEKKYMAAPETYSNYKQLKTAKIMAIIAIALGVLTLLYILYAISQMGGWDAYMERSMEMMEEWGIEE